MSQIVSSIRFRMSARIDLSRLWASRSGLGLLLLTSTKLRISIKSAFVCGAAPVVAGVVLLALGCYDPQIKSGGLVCASSGKACPDGFVCSNGKCVKGGMCRTPIEPLCESNISGECDPVCRTGCACGLRCNIGGSGPVCTAAPATPKKAGEICSPNSDDCEPGYVCLLERCGNNLGRCYRHCRVTADCGAGSACNEAIITEGESNYRACSPAFQPCDPLEQTGCPDPALRCFLAGVSQTICDCPPTPDMQRAEGQTCFSDECGPGLACIAEGSQMACRRLCRSTADCATCTLLTQTLGYCR